MRACAPAQLPVLQARATAMFWRCLCCLQQLSQRPHVEVMHARRWPSIRRCLHAAAYNAACLASVSPTAHHCVQSEGAEVVIALTHMRLPNDLRLAENIPGIDLVLGGVSGTGCGR